MAGSEAFITALVINVVVFLIVMAIFMYIRKKHPKIYQPRCELLPADAPKPPPMRTGFFDWIRDALALTDQQLFDGVGLDALMYTRFYRFGLELSAFAALAGLVVLLPINATGSARDCTSDDADEDTGFCPEFDDITKLTMSHLDEKSDRMYAHALILDIIGLFAVWRIRKVYLEYIYWRTEYLKRGQAHHHAVLVRDVPQDAAAPEALKNFMSTMYDDVADVYVPRETKQLTKLVAKRRAMANKIEHVTAVIAANPDKPPPTTRTKLLCGEKVHAKPYFENKLAELNEETAAELDNVTSQPKYMSGGAVIFRSLRSATIAAQVAHTTAVPALNTLPAPEPHDVYWPNVGMGFWTRVSKHMTFAFATYMLILFWTIPVAFVSTLTTLENLSSVSYLTWITDIIDLSPVLKGFLEGFLPTLALIIFMALLPTILTAFSRAQGYPATSLIHYAMFRKLFLFYVINVFFVSLLAGAAFGSISSIASDPSSILSLLGSAVPATGTFFTTYIMIQAFSAFPMQLLRIGPLIVSWIKTKWLAKTSRERAAAFAPGPYNYGVASAKMLCNVLIGMTYSVVAPLITPFLIVYFAVGYVTHRYQLYWVHIPVFETGGMLWPQLFNRTIAAIFLGQLTVFAILIVKKAFISAALTIPLLVITLVFCKQTNAAMRHIPTYLALEPLSTIEEGSIPQVVGDEFTQAELKEPRNLQPDLDEPAGTPLILST